MRREGNTDKFGREFTDGEPFLCEFDSRREDLFQRQFPTSKPLHGIDPSRGSTWDGDGECALRGDLCACPRSEVEFFPDLFQSGVFGTSTGAIEGVDLLGLCIEP